MIPDKIFYQTDDPLAGLLAALRNSHKSFSRFTKKYRFALETERFYTDKELSRILRISRRALQEYRSKGELPFIRLGGKVLYRESDIIRILEKNYR